jgi:dTDP-4-dehydrorhamnose 3,5-epimerase-like enzyme
MNVGSKVQIIELADHGDLRGFSFTVPAEALQFLEQVQDIHVAAIVPGAIRGNHFHERRREVLVFTYQGAWSFHWDEGSSTPVRQRTFDGVGAVLIKISPGASHAVRNDAHQPLTLMAASSQPYDPADSIVRKVV